MLIHGAAVNSLSFRYVNIPLFSRTCFYKRAFGCFQAFCCWKQWACEHFYSCVCFQEQDFLGFNLDGEELGSEECAPSVLVEDTKFSSKLVVQFMFLPFVLKSCHFFMFLLTFRIIRFFKFYFFATLHGLWDLSSLTRDWTWAPAVRAPSPNHWTAKKFPRLIISFLSV